MWVALVGVDLSFVLAFITTLIKCLVVGYLAWKVCADTGYKLFRQKVVDGDMREWCGLAVGCGVGFAQFTSGV